MSEKVGVASITHLGKRQFEAKHLIPVRVLCLALHVRLASVLRVRQEAHPNVGVRVGQVLTTAIVRTRVGQLAGLDHFHNQGVRRDLVLDAERCMEMS